MRALLDGDTAMLFLSLGSDESFGWLLTRAGLRSYRLPARANVEALARRAYAELSVNDPSAGRKAVAELGRILLSPIAGRLQDRRLVVVAEGALAYIPFSVLPLPSSGEMLMTDHEIVDLPSASALATVRKELRQRHPAPNAVAVFADPVFRADDPRVAGAAGSAAAHDGSLSDVERSARQSGVMTFDRLAATRREADTIVALAGRAHSLEALDFGASREAATSPALAGYRIVHFASHMLLNSRHPELSGIVLSLVDPKGEPRNGFLQVHEIFNLRLHADLVVLSGCQTALGTDVRGEGLVGPVRAFMYAGAPRVVASLWKVPDRATAKLMQELYAAMLERHLTPAAALRRAQLALRNDPQWSAPYHWAGFVMQGDWR
jgi:CHAT domain-containing protein